MSSENAVQAHKQPLSDCSDVISKRVCSIESLILEKIKPAEPSKSARKRIDVAELITTEDYVKGLQEKKEMTKAKSIKKEKIEKENRPVKEPKKRGRKPKIQM